MQKKWEVQTKFSCGWENCWADDDGSPVFFDSKIEAELELSIFLKDMDQEFKSLNVDHKYLQQDYRVREVIS